MSCIFLARDPVLSGEDPKGSAVRKPRGTPAGNVRVFGSVARGEDTPESDVDLLVDFPASERGLFPLLRLAGEVERLVGRPVDVAAVEVMCGPVRERALAEAIPL
jgi:uncharacterized protein